MGTKKTIKPADSRTYQKAIKDLKERSNYYWGLFVKEKDANQELLKTLREKEIFIENLKREVEDLQQFKIKYKMLKQIFKPAIMNFCKETHGLSSFDKTEYFKDI